MSLKNTKTEYRIFYVAAALLLFVTAFAAIFPKIHKRYIAIKNLYPYVEKLSTSFEVEKSLLFAVIDVESSFDETAVSKKGAIGLMQLMPETAKETAENLNIKIERVDLFKKEINLLVGTAKLKELIVRYNDINLAIIAYNAGEGNVDRWQKSEILSKEDLKINDIPFKETREYAQKVLKKEKLYQVLFMYFRF